MFFKLFLLINLNFLIICAHSKDKKSPKDLQKDSLPDYNPLGALVR